MKNIIPSLTFATSSRIATAIKGLATCTKTTDTLGNVYFFTTETTTAEEGTASICNRSIGTNRPLNRNLNNNFCLDFFNISARINHKLGNTT